MHPKINELYFCKKTLNTTLNNFPELEKGKYYKLTHIYDSVITIILNDKISEISFSLDDEYDEYSVYFYFYEYFGDNQDARKYKLNKLLNDNV